jgi:hypothetical protein
MFKKLPFKDKLLGLKWTQVNMKYSSVEDLCMCEEDVNRLCVEAGGGKENVVCNPQYPLSTYPTAFQDCSREKHVTNHL